LNIRCSSKCSSLPLSLLASYMRHRKRCEQSKQSPPPEPAFDQIRAPPSEPLFDALHRVLGAFVRLCCTGIALHHRLAGEVWEGKRRRVEMG